VTRLVDGLVADSLAHRKADPRRRRVLVHITRRGLAPQRQLSERIAAEPDAILGKVEDSDVAALLESLARLVARLR
jgi:DNA-binding MarR family transcriptional regulator